MGDEETPKSAVELAMEKMKSLGDETPLTDKKRAEIAEVRSLYRAKIAEVEIHQAAKISQGGSPEDIETLRSELSTEKRRLNEDMEKKVQRIRTRS